MHSKKIALSLVFGMSMSTSWAETMTTANTTTVIEDKAVSKNVNNITEAQVEIRIEDIDLPSLE
ncbi:hypothetical protein [Acinetobacter silvestris]|uniref:TonB-dependent receptor n=1 Tax=Acinetobacter silvestris TaxID=1977882 RepID=A0A1Y3CC89_9GAMM|nr:hypothetical protein [Acinetobacter silvestris]OTG64300.1 hypothetical protein B9T28_12330 [Acinetobacter silvestris]